MSKPALVFLHGFPFNAASWDPQVAYFQDRYQVFAPDMRGHRDGPSGPGPWMLAHFAEDLRTALDAKKIEKAILCGLSMGGYIAMHFAEQYPERVAGLILSDTQADADSNEAKDKRFKTIQKIQKEGLHAFAEEFSKNVLSEKTLKDQPQIQKQVLAMITQNKPADVVMVVGALASRRDSNPYLPNFHVPALVLVGADDKITPPAAAEKLAKGLKNAELKVIENAGHLANLEQPDVFNAFVDQFLTARFK